MRSFLCTLILCGFVFGLVGCSSKNSAAIPTNTAFASKATEKPKWDDSDVFKTKAGK